MTTLPANDYDTDNDVVSLLMPTIRRAFVTYASGTLPYEKRDRSGVSKRAGKGLFATTAVAPSEGEAASYEHGLPGFVCHVESNASGAELRACTVHDYKLSLDLCTATKGGTVRTLPHVYVEDANGKRHLCLVHDRNNANTRKENYDSDKIDIFLNGKRIILNTDDEGWRMTRPVKEGGRWLIPKCVHMMANDPRFTDEAYAKYRRNDWSTAKRIYDANAHLVNTEFVLLMRRQEDGRYRGETYVMKVVRDIAAGEEVLVSYGSDYFYQMYRSKVVMQGNRFLSIDGKYEYTKRFWDAEMKEFVVYRERLLQWRSKKTPHSAKNSRRVDDLVITKQAITKRAITKRAVKKKPPAVATRRVAPPPQPPRRLATDIVSMPDVKNVDRVRELQREASKAAVDAVRSILVAPGTIEVRHSPSKGEGMWLCTGKSIAKGDWCTIAAPVEKRDRVIARVAPLVVGKVDDVHHFVDAWRESWPTMQKWTDGDPRVDLTVSAYKRHYLVVGRRRCDVFRG